MNLLSAKLNSSCHPLPFYETSVSAGFPSPALDYAEKALDLNEHLIPNPVSTFFMRAEEAITQLKEKVSQGHSKSAVAKELNISRETLYQYLRGN